MNPRGRPKVENPRNCDLNIRLTKDEKENIQRIANLLGVSKTDAILQGIGLLQKRIERKQK